MRYRDDIDLANTWIVSDTHFGHDNIVGFCHRPEDHDQVMIAEWRAHVPDDATVLHLGDLSYRSNARFKNITAKELTGARKLLIQGNHDDQRLAFYRQSGFLLVRPFMLGISRSGNEVYAPKPTNGVDGAGEKIQIPPQAEWDVSFSHYPWNVRDEGPMPEKAVRVHGHIHNNGYTRDGFVPFLRNHINMSVEQTKFRPVNLKLLLEGYLLGEYPETTPEQRQEAQERRAVNLSRKKAT